jgi:prepilin-type N-terminal cleavage/methylation domain-containing protein
VEKNVKNRAGMTLVEIMVVIALIAVIGGLAAGPFRDMLRKGKVEDRASSLHETFKWAQTQAMKGGGVEIVGGKIVTKRIYLAVNQTSNVYRVIQWRDVNSDNVMTLDEFTLLQERSLMESHFGVPPSVDKKACGNTAGAPADSVTNLTENICPTNSLFTGYRCARFDGKGFLSESMQNAATYVTNSDSSISYALSMNPAGVMTLCRWDGNAWTFIR